MKKKNCLILVIPLYLALSGCGNTATSKTEANSENVETALTHILADDSCFDERMEKWFVEFNRLQDNGLDVNQANTKAITLVDLESKTCGGDQAPTIGEAKQE